MSNKKLLYAEGQLGGELLARIDALREALQGVNDSLIDTYENDIECGNVDTLQGWMDYQKEFDDAKEQMEELLRTVQPGNLKGYNGKFWDVEEWAGLEALEKEEMEREQLEYRPNEDVL